MKSLTTYASPFIPAAFSLPAAALHFAAMSLKDFLKSTARKRFDWTRASVRWRRFSICVAKSLSYWSGVFLRRAAGSFARRRSSPMSPLKSPVTDTWREFMFSSPMRADTFGASTYCLISASLAAAILTMEPVSGFILATKAERRSACSTLSAKASLVFTPENETSERSPSVEILSVSEHSTLLSGLVESVTSIDPSSLSVRVQSHPCLRPSRSLPSRCRSSAIPPTSRPRSSIIAALTAVDCTPAPPQTVSTWEATQR